ncbi:MAG: SDR family NAD(P)-dependent oxidoreductase, partial [Actinomycetota bacterium]|nr:SDR family NAD(P)-dependent oxidoreductase [Actinomycetota bacterium]
MDLGLSGRPALVAAASRGLGFASALSLAREGARVAICARDGETVRMAAEEIRTATGSDVVAITADVSRADDAVRFVREAADALGGCHILVTNAGGPPPGRAVDMTDEDFLRAIELNFLSVVRMVREALPHMRRAAYGRIVAISSSSVKEPIPGLALSNAARAAATGYLKTLAREVAAEGITVNAVLPGRFLTQRTRELAESSGNDLDQEPAARAAA